MDDASGSPRLLIRSTPSPRLEDDTLQSKPEQQADADRPGTEGENNLPKIAEQQPALEQGQPSSSSNLQSAGSESTGGTINRQSVSSRSRPPKKVRMAGTAPPPMARIITKPAFSLQFSKYKTTTYSDVPGNQRTSGHLIRTLAWSPLGTLVATGAADKTLRVWNPERPNVKHSTELKGHTGAVEKVAFHPTRVSELASCSADGTVKFWDVRTKTAVNEIKTAGETGNFSLAWHPYGTGLLVGTKDDVLVPIDYTAMKTLGSYQQPVQINQTVFTWVGNHVFLTGGDGMLKLAKYPSMEIVHSVHASPSALVATDLTPNGDYLAVGGSDSIIALWDYGSWCNTRCFTKMTGPVRSISFSFDSSYVVGGSEEGSGLDIAHVYSGDYVYHIDAGTAPQVAWSPRSYALAYAGEGGARLKIIGDFEHKTG